MKAEIRQIQEINCPKCGGDLVLENVVGICEHCQSAFLLTDEEIEILKKQNFDNMTVKHDCGGIVSQMCRSNLSWKLESDDMIVSESMKNSVFHRKKMQKVKKNWEIPDEDDVYIIADTGIIPNKLGFAISSSGVYYTENSLKQKGKLTWKEFKMAKISAAGKDLLLINELHFSIASSAKDVERILKKIQQNI